jgi:hypothetical protein
MTSLGGSVPTQLFRHATTTRGAHLVETITAVQNQRAVLPETVLPRRALDGAVRSVYHGGLKVPCRRREGALGIDGHERGTDNTRVVAKTCSRKIDTSPRRSQRLALCVLDREVVHQTN